MRTRPRLLLRALVVSVLLVVPVSAGAPPGQYGLFSGQDRRITDLKTGLVWERSVSPAPINFATAQGTCTGGTRLPTMKELLTLIDEEPHRKYDTTINANVEKFIDPQAFGAETPTDRAYWTSSMQGPNRAWTVDFGTGETVPEGVDAKAYVRCVRFQKL